jgi:hypothetical protein
MLCLNDLGRFRPAMRHWGTDRPRLADQRDPVVGARPSALTSWSLLGFFRRGRRRALPGPLNERSISEIPAVATDYEATIAKKLRPDL